MYRLPALLAGFSSVLINQALRYTAADYRLSA
jgi:hypothetical protein